MNSDVIPMLFETPQDEAEDDDFNVGGGEIFATFSPWASWLSNGNPFAPVPITLFPSLADGSAGAGSDPGSTVAVTSGGITINLLFDAAAMAAPASFRAGIQQAVAILAATISDKITVNLKIDYSGTGGGAAAGPDHGLFESYSSTRVNLINNATPGDTTFNALATGSTIQGQSNVAVWNAQLKLWGLMAANDTTTDDGAATFATDINPNLLVGVALHELTHAMGRVPYGTQPDVFDFFRFTSAGTRLFQGGATAPAAYFSLNGGNTKIADYGQKSDPSDFLNSGVQGANDPFNEFYNGATSQHLTAVDLQQLDALGFHLTSSTPGSVAISDASVVEGNSGTNVETFTVTRSGGTAAFDIGFTTLDNSATVADNDYVGKTGVLHFDANVNTQTISVTINGDTKVEADETFFVNLSGATNGAVISDSQGIGTIVNDDTGPLTVVQPLHVDDFNGDNVSDALWINPTTLHADVWKLSNGTLSGSVDIGSHPGAGTWAAGGVGDFNGDGTQDVLWYDKASGNTDIWELKNGNWSASVTIGVHPGSGTIAAVDDFNGDGTSDVLWKNSNGDIDEWQIVNGHWAKSVDLGIHPGSGWQIATTGDFNGDGVADVVWQSPTGDTDIWLLKNGNWMASVSPGSHPGGSNETIVGSGDYNGDGTKDILWQNKSTGDIDLWLISNGHWAGSVDIGTHPGSGWKVAATGDYNADGTSDILWENSATGETDIWEIQQGHWLASVSPGSHAASDFILS